MAGYYNAETLLEFVKQYTPHINGETTMECVETAILNAPTSDVAEVKHGYWIKGKRIGINVPQYTCSQCGKWEDAEFPYCHCGAKMDGGKI